MTTKEVRDLEWALKSPSLIANQPSWPNVTLSIDEQWCSEWLAELKKNPAPLQHHLTKRTSHFLGSYFESLWAFYLSECPDLELVAQNLQVRTLKKTIGEFDFIIFDQHSKQFIHQEIAIKFYLGFSKENSHPFSEPSTLWIGPQCRDRLDLKVGKLIDSQSRLSQNEFGMRTLQKMGINDIRRQVIVKGYLFYPYENNALTPNYCNPDHLHGGWLSIQELQKKPYCIETPTLSSPVAQAWKILSKSDWVSPFVMGVNPTKELTNNSDFFTDRDGAIDGIIKRVTDEERPWMLANLTHQGDYYIETSRIFIVPNHWPNMETYPRRP